MKTRGEIKAQAKAAFRGNYGISLLTLVLFLLISAVVGSITFGLGFIVLIPLELGFLLIYLKIYNGEKPAIDTMFTSVFNSTFARKLGGMLWMSLFVWLWSWLFVIPGLVKAYSYAATPIILAKYPNVKAKDALKLSMRIMDGHKADLFIFDLSFIGWHLLGMLTFGILEIFYVLPYYYTARTGMIDECIEDAIAKGKINRSELCEESVVVG